MNKQDFVPSLPWPAAASFLRREEQWEADKCKAEKGANEPVWEAPK